MIIITINIIKINTNVIDIVKQYQKLSFVDVLISITNCDTMIINLLRINEKDDDYEK